MLKQINITALKCRELERLEAELTTFPYCLLEWSINRINEEVYLTAQAENRIRETEG